MIRIPVTEWRRLRQLAKKDKRTIIAFLSILVDKYIQQNPGLPECKTNQSKTIKST